jgi:hypothetical protein
MVKLKNGVTGFIYDSVYGSLEKIFTEPLTTEQENLVREVLNDDSVLFTNNEDINELFEFESEEKLMSDSEGMSEVLEWVK